MRSSNTTSTGSRKRARDYNANSNAATSGNARRDTNIPHKATLQFRKEISSKSFALNFSVIKRPYKKKINTLKKLMNQGADPKCNALVHVFRSRDLVFIKQVITSFLKYRDIDSKFESDFSGGSGNILYGTTLLDCAVRHTNAPAVKYLLGLGASPTVSGLGHSLNFFAGSQRGIAPYPKRPNSVSYDQIFEMLSLFKGRGLNITNTDGNNVLDRIVVKAKGVYGHRQKEWGGIRGYRITGGDFVLWTDSQILLTKDYLTFCVHLMKGLGLRPANPSSLVWAIESGIDTRYPKLFKEFVVLMLQGKPQPNSLFASKRITSERAHFQSLIRDRNTSGTATALLLLYWKAFKHWRYYRNMPGLLNRNDTIILSDRRLNNFLKCFQVLLDVGVNPNARDTQGNTFLHLMQKLNQYELPLDKWSSFENPFIPFAQKLVTMLIDEYSANPFIKNKEGKTALDITMECIAKERTAVLVTTPVESREWPGKLRLFTAVKDLLVKSMELLQKLAC